MRMKILVFASLLILACTSPAHARAIITLSPIDAIASAGNADRPTRWDTAQRADTLHLPRTYQGYIHYRATMTVAREQLQSLGLHLGRIGDVDEVYVNGRLIGRTGNFPPEYHYAGDQYRIYQLPVLQSGDHELYVKTYSEYTTRKGIDITAVWIDRLDHVQQQQYFATWKSNLTATIMPMLALMLVILAAPWHPRSERREQGFLFGTAFMFICLVSAARVFRSTFFL